MTKYLLVSKPDGEFHTQVCALGHEIHISRFILFDLLQKDLIDSSSIIVTLNEDRIFLYNKTFKNVITWNNYINNQKNTINKIPVIDLTYYNCVSTQNEQIKEFCDLNYNFKLFERTDKFISFVNNINFYDLSSDIEYSDIIKSKFIVIHSRSILLNQLNTGKDTRYDIHSHLLKIINEIRKYSNLKIVVFCFEKIDICLENIYFINNLQIYATFLNNENCDLFITEWSGGGQISQYCCNSKIIYYFYNYTSHDYELLYDEFQKGSDNKHNIFHAWDFKCTTSCKRSYYKNLDIFLENLHLHIE